GEVVLADVRLDLDDATDPTPGRAGAIGLIGVADQVRPEQGARRLERRCSEVLAPERRWTARGAQVQRRASWAAERNVSRTSCGNRKPKAARIAGITLWRRMSTVSDLSRKSKSVRRTVNSPSPAVSRTCGWVKYGSRMRTIATRMMKPSSTPRMPPTISSSTG